MKILVFTEGTILMHPSGEGVSREERVKQVKKEAPGLRGFKNYIPIGRAVDKLKKWQAQGAEIFYLTSRKKEGEVAAIKNVLKKYHFPEGKLLFRCEGEEYKDVAERLVPNILIEDDCESIGGEEEMTYTHIKPDLKDKIKLIEVKEFDGIDHLPNSLASV